MIELIFLLFFGLLATFFIIFFTFAWSWGQRLKSQEVHLVDLLAVASIEWGSFFSLLFLHFKPLKTFYEAPPLIEQDFSSKQIPVIFVPSLHFSVESFGFLYWRLRKNYWNSLWPFRFKFFLKDSALLEDQLFRFIQNIIEKTEANRFRIVSFGSSRPIIAKVLEREDLSAPCDRWIALSSPITTPKVYKLLAMKKVKKVYEQKDKPELRNPDLLLVGENDIICYPQSVWGESNTTVIPNIGHFGTLLHSITTHSLIRELQ